MSWSSFRALVYVTIDYLDHVIATGVNCTTGITNLEAVAADIMTSLRPPLEYIKPRLLLSMGKYFGTIKHTSLLLHASILLIAGVIILRLCPTYIIMSTQTALVVREIGQPLAAAHDWPIPQPGPGQIQVRVTVAGLNPHDQKARDRGLFIQDSLPSSLANDVAGVVTVLGEGVTKFKVGDKVFSQASFVGLQKYATLEADFTAIVPKGVSEGECATLPTNIIAGRSYAIGFILAQSILTPSNQVS